MTRRTRTPPTVEPGDDLLLLDHIEHVTHMSRSTLLQLVHSGKLPARKYGSGRNSPWRVRRSDLHHFITGE